MNSPRMINILEFNRQDVCIRINKKKNEVHFLK